MTLGTGIRFHNKKKILTGIQALLSELVNKGLLKEEEIEKIVAFSKEKLITANTPSEFDLALSAFFDEFKAFNPVEVKERSERLETVEQNITQALTEGQNTDYLTHLSELDASTEKGMLAWIQKLSPWDQSRAYEALTISSN